MEGTILPERRFLAAILALAVEDARRGAEPHRTEARQWLRSAGCRRLRAALDLDYGTVQRWLAQLDP